MSTREREYANLAFNKTGYPKIVKEIREDYNDYMDKLLKTAQDIHAILDKQPPKKRREVFYRIYNTQVGKLVYSNVVFNATDEHLLLVHSELFRGKNGNLTKPRATKFKKLKTRDRTFTLDCNGADLILSEGPDGSGLLHWDTFLGDGNVKYSVNGETFRIVIKAVNKHVWGKVEGGLFIGNDEYNMIDEGEGDYRDEITRVYGPLGEQRRAFHYGLPYKS